MNIAWLFRACATLGPIGYLPACGTIASLVTLPFIYALSSLHYIWYAIIFFLMLVVGFIVVHQTCRLYLLHDDPPMIVIDEVVGMLFVFLFVPWRTDLVILSFLLFRLFDISKIGGISYLELWEGAPGILADDLLAALYTQILVHLYIWLV